MERAEILHETAFLYIGQYNTAVFYLRRERNDSNEERILLVRVI